MERKEATVLVPSRGGEPPKDENKEPELPPGPNPELDDAKKKKEDEKMSAEDKALRERLELAVERLRDPSADIQKAALELLRKEIREATSSMTSVPKPLKFLSPHWSTLKTLYASAPASIKAHFADILSVLALTMGRQEDRDVLRYRLQGDNSSPDQLSDWGHEYIKALAGEIGLEYRHRTQENTVVNEADLADLLGLIRVILPFQVTHNAEVDATDLCIETGRLSLLLDDAVPLSQAAHKDSSTRVCLYLTKCSEYLGDAEEIEAALKIALELYLRHHNYSEALVTALKIGAVAAASSSSAAAAGADGLIAKVFASVKGTPEIPALAVRKQLGYILGRHRLFSYTYEGDDADEVNACIGNVSMTTLFSNLVKDLDTAEPKAPEDIYKSHLVQGGESAASSLDSAMGNLGSTFVNAFVNAGYGTDKLMTVEDSRWVYKNKAGKGQMAAAASLGAIYAWKEEQLSSLDKFLHAEEEGIKAGALLGIALCCTGTRNLDVDPVFNLLMEHIEASSTAPELAKEAACLGLGMAYAGSQRSDLVELLLSYVSDAGVPWNRACYAGLAVGMIQVGSADEASAAVIADRLLEGGPTHLRDHMSKQLSLGLGLLFLGRGAACDTIVEVLKTIEDSTRRIHEMLVKVCAYAGTGNVLELQAFLRLCAERPEATDRAYVDKAKGAEERNADRAKRRQEGQRDVEPDEPVEDVSDYVSPHKYLYQSAAALGLATVALGEELSVDMAGRMADHLLQYGEAHVKSAVPLVMALLHVSDPDYGVVDTLSKLSHDPAADVSQAAIFALGMVGAGTNNSRIAGLLRTLAVFYKSQASHLLIIRLAQGILHMGKGLVTVSPLHWGRQLVSPVLLACLLPSFVLFLEPGSSIANPTLGHTALLYTLFGAMNPRYATTVDVAGEPVPVEVRVGQAVETVGQAGKPKTITGFQTHTTPVLLNAKDRAELAGDEHLSLTNVLEGVAILVSNPDAQSKKKKKGADKK